MADRVPGLYVTYQCVHARSGAQAFGNAVIPGITKIRSYRDIVAIQDWVEENSGSSENSHPIKDVILQNAIPLEDIN